MKGVVVEGSQFLVLSQRKLHVQSGTFLFPGVQGEREREEEEQRQRERERKREQEKERGRERGQGIDTHNGAQNGVSYGIWCVRLTEVQSHSFLWLFLFFLFVFFCSIHQQ